MSSFITDDNVEIYYKDWAAGQPIVFSHGWPLSADAWDAQMLFFGRNGYRVVAHDRRGHGRSQQTWDHNDMDRYADDLAQLIEHLDLTSAILVGHSMGGGELVRYIARHGSQRVSKVILIGAVTPLMLQSELNQTGIPLEIFDGLRDKLEDNRSQFYLDFARAFYGYDREGAVPSAGFLQSFWQQGMMGGIKAHLDCIRQFSETDFHADLAQVDVPSLVLHSEDDSTVPFAISGQRTARLIKGATLKSYKGLTHAMPLLNADLINHDILEFLRG